jgi:hypothetical protein
LNEYDIFNDNERQIIKQMAVFDFDSYAEEFLTVTKKRAELGDLEQPGARAYIKKVKDAFNLEGEIRRDETQLKLIEDFINKAAEYEKLLKKEITDTEEDKLVIERTIVDSKSNIDIQMRFEKGIVELPLKQAIDLLNDAILIEKKTIKELNSKIEQDGKLKVQKLTDNLNLKNDVEQTKFDVMTKELDIEDTILESMAITRLKVTKQIQAALAESQEMEVRHLE